MTPKDVVKAFHSAFVARDVDALCALYADDAVNHQVAEEPLRGKAAIRKASKNSSARSPTRRRKC